MAQDWAQDGDESGLIRNFKIVNLELLVPFPTFRVLAGHKILCFSAPRNENNGSVNKSGRKNFQDARTAKVRKKEELPSTLLFHSSKAPVGGKTEKPVESLLPAWKDSR